MKNGTVAKSRKVFSRSETVSPWALDVSEVGITLRDGTLARLAPEELADLALLFPGIDIAEQMRIIADWAGTKYKAIKEAEAMMLTQVNFMEAVRAWCGEEYKKLEAKRRHTLMAGLAAPYPIGTISTSAVSDLLACIGEFRKKLASLKAAKA